MNHPASGLSPAPSAPAPRTRAPAGLAQAATSILLLALTLALGYLVIRGSGADDAALAAAPGGCASCPYSAPAAPPPTDARKPGATP